ncbi:MAG: 4'-phosphopantetheinyl transferase superfamily protein [Anaerolineales bacterium]|nr:4'-phosphopantetheinyl transferase superfamily protein [Anaerolineales bacterium]
MVRTAWPARRPDLAPGVDEVHLWHTRVDRPGEEGGQGGSLLSAGERDRAAHFRREVDRIRYVAVHAFLRRTLARYLSMCADEIDFIEGPAGKPALTQMPGEPDLRFNLSHSGDHAFIAVTIGREVGVDFEVIQPDVDALGLAEEVFSANICKALRLLSSEARVHAFYRTWTRLEAVLKARGVGFSLDPRSVQIPLEADSPLSITSVKDGESEPLVWTVHDFELAADIIGAVAVEGEGCQILACAWGGA